MVVPVTEVRMGPPLPLVPAGSTRLNGAVAICEDEEGGMAFIWGIATCSWGAGDACARRLAAVQLGAVGAAKPGEVAAGFGVDYSTFARWRDAYQRGGVEGLGSVAKGPKGPSKLTEQRRRQIVALRRQGKTVAEVGKATGVSARSVARVATAEQLSLGEQAGPSKELVPLGRGELVPLGRPLPRPAERQAARAGLLAGAPPVFTPGAGLPFAGSLLILPCLVATGLLEAFEKVYPLAKAAFYSARSLMLSFVFAVLVGAGRAERAGRFDPASMGRLLGLDRGPTAHTIRRRFEELARLQRSGELWHCLAVHHLAREGLPEGIIYLDGHVRAYHGKADLPKAHLARMRIAMAATEDLWLTDTSGEAVLVWAPEPGSGLAGELRNATSYMRALLGDDHAAFTLTFDRGGWSPKLFDELRKDGVDTCTYRKAPKSAEPRSSFARHVVTDSFGHQDTYLLADRPVRVPYTDKGERHFFPCRQVTRLDEKSGHQTQVLTTRRDLPTGSVAQAMFGRWSEENVFKYGRRRFELDGLDSYAKVPDDPERSVPNPAKKEAAKKVKAARSAQGAAEAELAKAVSAGTDRTLSPAEANEAIAAATEQIEVAKAAVEKAKAAQGKVPARVALGEVHPEAARLDPERKRILDAVRLSAYNAETTLCRMLRPHYSRAEDEARALAQEIYRAPGDIEVVSGRLVVRLEPLSAPHRTRALAALCEELTASETTYPGTDLTVVYEVKER